MDLPTTKGVRLISPASNVSSQVTNRKTAVEKLISWGGVNGVLSKDSAEFIIGENGRIRCVANRFIPANKHILHVPFGLDLSFATLKNEIHPEKTWIGWTDLKTRIKTFEESFAWNPYNFEQKDYFSKNVLLAMCIVGVNHKLKSESSKQKLVTDSATPAPEHSKSFILEVFEHYWNALPQDIGNVLYNWNPLELMCLQGSSFGNCLPDARRFGEEIYHKVIVPFLESYAEYFGPPISIEEYFKINSIILTRSFGTGKKEKSALLPIIDLVNGKPNDLHNCTLENCAIQKEINGEFIKFHVIESCCDIHAGEEIFLEYAQVGNGDYLMTYNYLPLDPEVIMNNQKTDIFLDLSEFFETELLRMHPNSPPIRSMKRQHIYGFFNLPKTIPITMEDLFSSQYSCIPSIRQVLIFLQFDENDAKKSIKTSRIKSQLSPHQLHHLFHLFLKFIECSLQKPNLALFRCLLDNKLPASMVQNYQQLISNYWNHSHQPIVPVPALLPPSPPPKSGKKDKNKKDKDNHNAANTNNNDSSNSAAAALNSSSYSSCSSLSSSLTPTSTGYFYSLTTTFPAPPSELINAESGNRLSPTITSGDEQVSSVLTENMKSAIYLQMSERLVIEVMINRFINLFPERFHELGYSIMREHLVSSEVNSILEELCKPMIIARQTQCIICGSKLNLSKCSRCRKAYYCSANCQKEHWPYHRNVCRPSSSKESVEKPSNSAVNTHQSSGSTTKESKKTPSK